MGAATRMPATHRALATQDGAWRQQRQAQAQGYGTSNVFPCTDANGFRGYCFNVFSPC